MIRKIIDYFSDKEKATLKRLNKALTDRDSENIREIGRLENEVEKLSAIHKAYITLEADLIKSRNRVKELGNKLIENDRARLKLRNENDKLFSVIDGVGLSEKIMNLHESVEEYIHNGQQQLNGVMGIFNDLRDHVRNYDIGGEKE